MACNLEIDILEGLRRFVSASIRWKACHHVMTDKSDRYSCVMNVSKQADEFFVMFANLKTG